MISKIMQNSRELPGVNYDDPQKKQEEEIVALAKKNNLSGDEIYTAYKMAMGIISEDETAEKKEPIRPEIKELAQKIEALMADGLAANRITGLIDSKFDYESAEETYKIMIDIMQINDKEKKTLLSIVENKRSGTLTIIDAQTRQEHDIKILLKTAGEKYEPNDIAALLIGPLKGYMNKKVEILFVE
jgi:hypothetical protein